MPFIRKIKRRKASIKHFLLIPNISIYQFPTHEYFNIDLCICVLTRCQSFQHCCLQGIVQELWRLCCRCSRCHRPGRYYCSFAANDLLVTWLMYEVGGLELSMVIFDILNKKQLLVLFVPLQWWINANLEKFLYSFRIFHQYNPLLDACLLFITIPFHHYLFSVHKIFNRILVELWVSTNLFMVLTKVFNLIFVKYIHT